MDVKKIVAELTLEEKAGLCSGHDYWHTKSVERLGIPSVMMCDGPHGLRKQKGEGDHLGINESIETVCYPTASALASSFDRKVMEKLGEKLGEECQAENVGMLLGPGINMKRSPLCGRNFEYFSEDPYLTGELAASYVSSLQKKGIAACVKHFAANNQETRRMSGSSELDERTLHEIYLPAFEKVVKDSGVRSVMCAYNAVNAVPCSENKRLLTDILRDEWGFDGMVVTDWGAVKNRVKGLLAGLDLEMPGGPGNQDAQIVEAVKNGTISESVLDEAVENILRFICECQEQHDQTITADRDQYRNISEELCTECAVLLKNEDVLPINPEEEVLFIGEFAKNPRYQGAGSSHIHVSSVEGAIDAAKNAGYRVSYAEGYRIHEDKETEKLRKEAVEAASGAKYAVIFAGLPDAYETEGCDRESLDMPQNQNELIEAVAEVQPNTIVVLHGGAPMVLPWIQKVAAVLCMYLGGERTGASSVSLLFGEKVPSGKLAETWPLKLEDNPSFLNFPGEDGIVPYKEGIYIGYRYYDKKKMDVLFPFGHGLSYSSFEYSELWTEKTDIRDDETLKVSCKVKNIGVYKAKEIIQLYVRDCKSSVGRPVRELKGFEKVELSPGEETTVFFELDQRAFAYYEPKIGDWFVESGEFDIEIGASSRDIRLTETVTVSGTKELPITYTYDSTLGDLSRSEKGRLFLQQTMQQGGAKGQEEAEKDNVKNMGEGSEKMIQSMMMEMPLRNIVTFGRMTMAELDALLTSLNEEGK